MIDGNHQTLEARYVAVQRILPVRRGGRDDLLEAVDNPNLLLGQDQIPHRRGRMAAAIRCESVGTCQRPMMRNHSGKLPMEITLSWWRTMKMQSS